MAATFQPGLTRPLDRVRFRVGDINAPTAEVQDETIEALLAETGATVLSVSAQVSKLILAAYTSRVTYDVDGQGERWSDAAKSYRLIVADIAEELAAEKAGEATEEAVAAGQAVGGGIMVGGLSVKSNVRKSEDSDRAANFSPRYDGC